MYFSATDTTKEIVCSIANKIAGNTNSDINIIDFTLPDTRKKVVSFSEEDIVIIGEIGRASCRERV